jgi:hypothetical protein
MYILVDVEMMKLCTSVWFPLLFVLEWSVEDDC